MNSDVTNWSQTSAERSVGQQVREILEIIGDTLLLFLRIFYFVAVSVYKKIVPPALKEVKGKVVVITGTGHGIGRELAYLYSQEGAIVVGLDVNEKGNEETFNEIVRNGHQKGCWYTCDVSKRENVLEISKKITKEVGDVSVLINNAGIMPCHPVEKHTPEEIERIFKINVIAHFWTLEAFLPIMKKNNDGHIVALSSCAGLFGLKNLVPYCASKFAVRGLMEALYEEIRVAPNNQIKTTIVFPYMTDTGLCKNPKIRFKNSMRLLNPQHLAQEIMRAQRSDIFEISVPSYLQLLNSTSEMLPHDARIAIGNYLDTYVDSDLK
ncbi:short-chain dehydrogenase/reductase family 16C member 6 [Agrilus planipennis]|uniref:Short-chain dehydrogenase/reductase 3 n=1 Tax=Agrilus planipennis TaxID=224129 RepID=A0A7F5R709_AGRPL|nr:short-chain dehydrogenase/reductase family 16C member 6 [Agrilus planipennis]